MLSLNRSALPNVGNKYLPIISNAFSGKKKPENPLQLFSSIENFVPLLLESDVLYSVFGISCISIVHNYPKVLSR